MAEGARTVAELFAALGIDSSKFDEGMRTAELRMEAFKKPVADTIGMLKQLSTAMDPSVISQGLTQLETRARTAADAIQQLHAAASEPIQGGPRSLISLGEEDIISKQVGKASLTRSAMAEKASSSMYAAMIKQQGQQLAQAQREATAEESAAWSAEMAYYQRRLADRKTEIAEELYLYKQEAEMRRKTAFQNSPAGSIGFRGTAVEVQALDRLVGITLPRGLTSVIARLGVVQQFMVAAFAPLAVIAFIEILSQLGEKLQQLTYWWNGYGEAVRKSNQDAYLGFEQSRLGAVNYYEKLADLTTDMKAKGLSMASFGLPDTIFGQAKGELARQKSDAFQRQSQLTGFIEEMEHPKTQLNEMTGDFVPVLSNQLRQQLAQGETLEKFQEQLKAVNKSLGDMENKTLEIKIKEAREALEHTKKEHESMRKMRDEVHEFPLSLPWFLMGSGKRPMISRYEMSPRTPVASMLRSGGDPSAMPTMPAMTGGGGGGVSFSPVFAPSFVFHGVPADVQKFMRDQAEPVLLNDFRKNMNGILEQLKGILRSQGVRVNG